MSQVQATPIVARAVVASFQEAKVNRKTTSGWSSFRRYPSVHEPSISQGNVPEDSAVCLDPEAALVKECVLEVKDGRQRSASDPMPYSFSLREQAANQARGAAEGAAKLFRRPAVKLIALGTPSPAQRAQLPTAIQGQPRVEEERLESLLRAAQDSHVAGARALLHPGHRRSSSVRSTAWRGRLVPLAAAPWILLVPACLACRTTRSVVEFGLVVHLVMAMVIALAGHFTGYSSST